jgi:hypothetical protein
MNFTAPTNQQNYQVPGVTSPNGTTVLVGIASITAIGPNQNRRGLRFFNPSAVIMYVCPANQAAVIGQGVPILPSAGPVDMIGDGKLINYNSGWNVISATGSNNPLTILELL